MEPITCLNCEGGEMIWQKGRGSHTLYWCKRCGTLSHFFLGYPELDYGEVPLKTIHH